MAKSAKTLEALTVTYDAQHQKLYDELTDFMNYVKDQITGSMYSYYNTLSSMVWHIHGDIEGQFYNIQGIIRSLFAGISSQIADVHADIATLQNEYVRPLLFELSLQLDDIGQIILGRFDTIIGDVHNELSRAIISISDMFEVRFGDMQEAINTGVEHTHEVIESYFYDIPYNLFVYAWNMLFDPKIKPKEPPTTITEL